MTIALGALEKVDLRKVWVTEAGHFTPWLALSKNLKLLGDTLGLELEVQGTEQSVGPYRADILCKDTRSGQFVLIENQLEATDHSHLGQLLTYAAGLNTVTIIWVAPKFTDEHRAALDWLNEITDEKVNFFGLEIQVWKIGDSLPAPKFNVVSQPNNWTKTIKVIREGDYTKTQLVQLEYWERFIAYMMKRGTKLKMPKPQADNYLSFAVGSSKFQITTSMRVRDQLIGVWFNIVDPQHQEIAVEIGNLDLPFPLSVEISTNRSYLGITLQPAPLQQREDWVRQHEWLAKNLEAFVTYFRPLVQSMKSASK